MIFSIYKIQHKELKYLFYIGCTSNLHKRILEHKSNFNNTNLKSYNSKIYKYIRHYGGIENFNIEEVEKIYSKKEAVNKEQEYIKVLQPVMNSINVYITNEDKKKYQREYHIAYNKTEKYKIYQREYHRKYNKKKKFKIQLNNFLILLIILSSL
jgi:predicted GIY-YIG superfamily endonuclease